MRVNGEENEKFWSRMNILSSTNEKFSLLHELGIEYGKSNEIKTIYDNSYMVYAISSLVFKIM